MAVDARMKELEGCERAKLTADMTMKRSCMKASSEEQMRSAHMQAEQAK